jgi:hypothetical protein
MEMQTQTTKTMSAIDRALAAAKARKSAKDAASKTNTVDVVETKPKVSVSKEFEKKQKAAANEELTTLQKSAKAEKKAAEEAAKAERKAKRDADRAERRSAKEAAATNKKPSHMKKVERARSKCPALNGPAEALFNEATTNLSILQIEALSQHLVVQARAMRTIRAAQTAVLALGSTVRITGGDPKFVGAVGKVVHSHKLRAKVEVPGVSKPVYIYTGEAEVVDPT